MNQDLKFARRKRNESAIDAQSKILKNQYFFSVYSKIYQRLAEITGLEFSNSLTLIEIGASGSIGKLLFPALHTLDVRPGLGVDSVLKSFELPFANSSVDAVIGKDVLHHMDSVESHFLEIDRVLRLGQSAVYLEPNWNLWSRFILYLFHPEPFVRSQTGWNFKSTDPMYSNQALPWIIFVRDKRVFEKKFPNLVPQIHESFIGISYVLSGGVNGRVKTPQKFLVLLFKIELKLGKYLNWFHLARFVSVTKISS